MQRWAIKDRKVMDLTEAEGIKKGWQEYTEELYKKKGLEPYTHKKIFMPQITTML